MTLASLAVRAQLAKAEDPVKTEESARPANAHKAMGVMKKADPGKGSVMLAHEPPEEPRLAGHDHGVLGQGQSIVRQAAGGRKIDLEFVRQGNDDVITSAK